MKLKLAILNENMIEYLSQKLLFTTIFDILPNILLNIL